MIQGNSLAVFFASAWTLVYTSVAVPEDRASRTLEKTARSLYFSSSHICIRSERRFVVLDFFSAAAPAKSSGKTAARFS